jgi:hypothetical protein
MTNRFAKAAVLVTAAGFVFKAFGSFTPAERIYYYETKSFEQAAKKNELLDRLVKEFGVDKKQALAYHNEILGEEETQAPAALAKAIKDHYDWEYYLQEQDKPDSDLTYFINSRINWSTFPFDEFSEWYGIAIDKNSPKWTNRCTVAMGTDMGEINELFKNELDGIKATETVTPEKNSNTSLTPSEVVETPSIDAGTSVTAV